MKFKFFGLFMYIIQDKYTKVLIKWPCHLAVLKKPFCQYRLVVNILLDE